MAACRDLHGFIPDKTTAQSLAPNQEVYMQMITVRRRNISFLSIACHWVCHPHPGQAVLSGIAGMTKQAPCLF